MGMESWRRRHGLEAREPQKGVRVTKKGREVASIRTESWLVPHLVLRDACPFYVYARSGTTCPRGG